MFYQSILDFNKGEVHVGDPYALSTESLLSWLGNLMSVFENTRKKTRLH
jgi:hypothetical protein